MRREEKKVLQVLFIVIKFYLKKISTKNETYYIFSYTIINKILMSISKNVKLKHDKMTTLEEYISYERNL
jgi:uncharacterized protein affecting Mg2+/Co2+ transport